MMLLEGKFLSMTELPAKGDFPPSTLTTVLDSGEPLSLLVCSSEARDRLASMSELEKVTLQIRWRKLRLEQVSGNLYRLQVVAVLENRTEGEEVAR